MKSIPNHLNYTPKPIERIAEKAGINLKFIEPYGHYKGKIDLSLIKTLPPEKKGKLIFCTTINPTPAGEGKTTTTIALADALNLLGRKTILNLREPALGPLFGVRGGAIGGGKAQIIPRYDLILHFTGDMHALSSANNLISAVLDNHIYQGNELSIDIRKIIHRHTIDMNDRQLRNIVTGLGKSHGTPREDGFDITPATELMTIFCLAKDYRDLKTRIGNIIIAYNQHGRPVTVEDLKISGAVTILLKEAFKPNLVQSTGGTPAMVHGGPFANIAHGCCSNISTDISLKLADFVVTEAGFGADTGGEKFLDIKCRLGGYSPEAVVIVVSLKALKYHGGVDKKDLTRENLPALKKGLPNLIKHIDNFQQVFQLPVLVAINSFEEDTFAELNLLKEECSQKGTKAILAKGWNEGGSGAIDLAEEIINLTNQNHKSSFQFAYPLDMPVIDKIETIAGKIYGAEGCSFAPHAYRELERIENSSFRKLPVCLAKTQFSLSDNPVKLGRPQNFKININDLRVHAGAGLIIALTGDIMTMPGLPRVPSAIMMDIDEEGNYVGLSS